MMKGMVCVKSANHHFSKSLMSIYTWSFLYYCSENFCKKTLPDDLALQEKQLPNSKGDMIGNTTRKDNTIGENLSDGVKNSSESGRIIFKTGVPWSFLFAMDCFHDLLEENTF